MCSYRVSSIAYCVKGKKYTSEKRRYDILDTFFLPLYFFTKYTTIKKILYLIFFYDIMKSALEQNDKRPNSLLKNLLLR